MREWPYTIRPQGVEIRPDADGLYVAFHSEPPYRPEQAGRFAQSFSRAFDTEVEIGVVEGEHRYASIKGLDMTQEKRVRTVMDALHIVHVVHADDIEECPDICLALDWHMDPNSGSSPTSATKIGQLRNSAKREIPDRNAAVTLANTMYKVIRAHCEMKNVKYIASPPSSIEFAGWLAHTLGYWMNVLVLDTEENGMISSQQDAFNQGEKFEKLCERRKDTISIQADALSGSVLIVDDLYGSGGTIREITRQCRTLGAERILAMPVTKSLNTHHRA